MIDAQALVSFKKYMPSPLLYFIQKIYAPSSSLLQEEEVVYIF
jgi:hypothetical protein